MLLSIYTQKRLIHSGANGFKPDNVPLSLRDTGYCHSDHKVSLPVRKVTLLANTTIYSVGSLLSGYNIRSVHVHRIQTKHFKVTEMAQV